MAITELDIHSSDGHHSRLRMHDVSSSGPGLLFMPALGVPAQKYDAFGQALAAAGVVCAVHEWRGMGSSSQRAARGVDWGYRELLQRDIPASLAALDPARRWLIGGHSLGGQLAALAAAQQPERFAGLVLLATGLPHGRTFRGRQRLGVGLFARVLPALTAAVGSYPGERLGFAGREAGGVMRDWAATVRSGRYLAYGNTEPMDTALARLALPVLALRLTRDWLVPEASLAALLAKLGPGDRRLEIFDDARLGAQADHFKWMRAPAAIADVIAGWAKLSP